MRDMYGWLWDGILYRLNNISAEAANHCIKDKKYQEIINQVPPKNNTGFDCFGLIMASLEEKDKLIDTWVALGRNIV